MSQNSTIEKASKLLDSRHKDEGNIQKNTVLLLDSMGIESLCQHRTPAGPADIFCPSIRTIFEIKARGKARHPDKPQSRKDSETPRQQLERYIQAEAEYEAGFPLLQVAQNFDDSWVGILTDGKTWHTWKYPKQIHPNSKEIFRNFCPRNPEELLQALEPLLLDQNRQSGKPLVSENPAPEFMGFLPDLQLIFQNMPNSRVETKFSLWMDMLRASGMEPNNTMAAQALFIRHSLLIAIARGVIHTLAAPNTPPESNKVLSSGFVSWMLSSTEGKKQSEKILKKVHSLEWRHRQQDVLRNLYQNLIDSEDRKVFGEYYTPDWLAELLVSETLDEEWMESAIQKTLKSNGHLPPKTGMMDPACGSGTFLYHAVHRLRFSKALKKENLDPSGEAEVIANLINGIDVHPIAVEISRATVMRALPGIPPSGKDAINVFQGDALMSMKRSEGILFARTSKNFLLRTPKGKELQIPISFAKSRGFPSSIKRLVESARDNNPFPTGIEKSVPKKDRKDIRKLHSQLTKVIADEGNSVWSWYIIHSTAPFLLAERKVDRILANPPWVTMSDIQVQSRKTALEQLFQETKLHSGGRHAPKQDIAQLFVHHCRNLYLENPFKNSASWVTNSAILKAPAWRNLRKNSHWKNTACVDLGKIPVFSGAKSAVILEYPNVLHNLPDGESTLEASKNPDMDFKGQYNSFMSIEKAIELIEFQPPQKLFSRQKSDYEGEFSQGATVTPEVLAVISKIEPGRTRDTKRVTTSPSRHMPWKELDIQTGEVPLTWIRPIIKATDIFPFSARQNSTQAIVPVRKTGYLHPDPCSVSRFWKELDEIYQENAGKGKTTPKTLLGRINFQRAVARQISELGGGGG